MPPPASTAKELYGETKSCAICGFKKPLSDFGERRKGKPWLQSFCKLCDSERASKRHASLSNEEKKRISKENYKRKRVFIDECYVFINEAKNKPCADCGHSYPPYVMDFDHPNDDKVDSIAKMVYRGSFSLEDIKREAEKCDVVCSNCHRTRTFTRAGKASP